MSLQEDALEVASALITSECLVWKATLQFITHSLSMLGISVILR